MIITRTPFRISFFGGGTDFPLWYRENGGVVLATTIDKYCYITCRYLPPFFEHKHRIVYSVVETVNHINEINHPSVRAVMNWVGCNQGIEIHHDGDLPARSGLGSSSAFTVGLIQAFAALEGRYIAKDELAASAIHVEQDLIGENVGSQDQISAAFGGFNRIEFCKNGTFNVVPIIISKDRLLELKSHLMLFFTGFSRISSEIARHQIEVIHKRHVELSMMKQMVDEGIAILTNKAAPIEEFGKLLHDSWAYKRSLTSKVSTPEIDFLYDEALMAGATGGKILGAGGGGFLLLFVKPELQKAVSQRLSHLIQVPFDFENSGSSVIFYQPNILA